MFVIYYCLFLLFGILFFAVMTATTEELSDRFGFVAWLIAFVVLVALGIYLPNAIFRVLGFNSEIDGEKFGFLIVLVNLSLWSLVLLIMKLTSGKLTSQNTGSLNKNLPPRINTPFHISEDTKFIISLIGFISSVLGIISFFLDHVF